MPSGIAQNPFLYQPRWAAIQEPNISDATKYLLEERDRELEDYLGSQTSGGGTASALRRTTIQSYNSGSAVPVDFNATDYLNGMTASGGTLVCVTAGVWSLTTYVPFAVGAGGDPSGIALQVVRSAAIVERIDSGFLPISTGNTGFANLTMDATLQAGDVVRAVVFETSGSGVVKGSVSAQITPARLSAHLVG